MRIAHSFVYMYGHQPWRTLSFGVGVLCLFVMGLQVLLTAM